MKIACLAMVLGATLRAALAADDEHRKTILDAAAKLAGQSSYAWVSTSKSAEGTLDWRQGPTHGATQLNGLTMVTFALGDNTVEMCFKGDKSAIKWEDQWRGPADLTGDYMWIAERLKSYMFAAQEAEFLAHNARQFTVLSDAQISAELTPKAITTLLSRGRRVVHEAPDMTGTVEFNLHQGFLTRFQYTVRGHRTFNEDQRDVAIDRTTVVEIKDIGATKVTIPDEAAKKIE